MCTSRGSAQGSVKKQLGSGFRFLPGSGPNDYGSGTLHDFPIEITNLRNSSSAASLRLLSLASSYCFRMSSSWILGHTPRSAYNGTR